MKRELIMDNHIFGGDKDKDGLPGDNGGLPGPLPKR
jgi:hypothetical protein